MLIRLTSLVSKDKILKKCSFRMRLVGLISTKTKEYFVGSHLCIRSIMFEASENVPLNQKGDCIFESNSNYYYHCNACAITTILNFFSSDQTTYVSIGFMWF